MNITGVIAEYNPFHNGHRYQLEAARTRTQADFILVIMNGDFMQRGLPALWNKYERAAMAIEHGADAVIELPVLYGTASAEYFAFGGIQILDQLHCVQQVCFGCETEDLPLLQTVADFLIQEPENYRQRLNQQLSQGISFPKARARAILQTMPLSANSASGLETILTEPNAILAVEYLKAITRLHSSLCPVPCLRAGSGHHGEAISGSFSSATAIRREYARHGCTSLLKPTLPASVYSVLADAYGQSSPVTMEDFYPFLQYILWKPSCRLTDYLDVSQDLSNRIRSQYQPEYTYEQLVNAIINRQYTYTRIYRALLHILLDIRKEDMQRQSLSNTMHYARLLAFRKEAAPLLKAFKQHSEIPVITKLTHGIRLLEEQGDLEGLYLLQQDIACAHLYEQARSRRYGIPAVNEFTRGLIIKDSGHV